MEAVVSGVDVEAVSYHQDTARAQFDHETTAPSTVVIATLAELLDADPIELDPLYNSVDPDALDAFVRGRKGTEGDISVSFRHESHAVSVYSYGVVSISPGDEPPARDRGRDAGR